MGWSLSAGDLESLCSVVVLLLGGSRVRIRFHRPVACLVGFNLRRVAGVLLVLLATQGRQKRQFGCLGVMGKRKGRICSKLTHSFRPVLPQLLGLFFTDAGTFKWWREQGAKSSGRCYFVTPSMSS